MKTTHSPSLPMTRPCALRARLGAFFLALLVLLMLCPAAQATTVIPPDFATMVKRAEVIFRGEVVSVRSEWAGEGSTHRIVSYITFNILKVLKGAPTSPYVLQMLGGTVDGQTMEVTGAPVFQVGDKTLLFVEHNGTQFIPLVGIMHGYFRVKTDSKTGQEIILRYNGAPLKSTTEIDQTHHQAVLNGGISAEAVATPEDTSAGMKRSDFEAEIQSKVASP